MMLTFLSIIFIIDDPFFRQPIVSDIVYSIRDRSPVDGKEWELIIFFVIQYIFKVLIYDNLFILWKKPRLSLIKPPLHHDKISGEDTGLSGAVCSCRISAASL